MLLKLEMVVPGKPTKRWLNLFQIPYFNDNIDLRKGYILSLHDYTASRCYESLQKKDFIPTPLLESDPQPNFSEVTQPYGISSPAESVQYPLVGGKGKRQISQQKKPNPSFELGLYILFCSGKPRTNRQLSRFELSRTSAGARYDACCFYVVGTFGYRFFRLLFRQ